MTKPVRAALWRILVDPIEPETESENGISYTKETIDAQEYLRYYGKVVDIGPLCFTDPRFYINGNQCVPCKIGDWIIYGRHTGIDVCIREGKYHVRKMRLINDDQWLGTIDDIEQVKIPLV